ncbi:MAG: DUF2971 domain-containing protein [Candidatus Symbiothrix sp.]|jgi:hypothetical protein|nr:DUF2971 domain-containing protein [Candidatus Symbiothrix sp.]
MENNSINYDDHETVMKMIIESGELPPVLYKYTTFDTGLKIIESGKIRFSVPTDFNDPFDCQLTIDTDNSDDELDLYVELLAKERGLTEKQKTEFRTKIQDSDYRFKLTNKAVKEATQELGISCFSLQQDNLLLWAHYAEKHNGIVLKLDILKDTSFFMTPYPINYIIQYPIFNDVRDDYFKGGGYLTKILVETKSLDWQYENEVRIMKQGRGDYHINKEAITDVIFGCQVFDSEKSKFVKIAQDNGWNHLKFTSAKKKDWQFGLDFSEYKTT